MTVSQIQTVMETDYEQYQEIIHILLHWPFQRSKQEVANVLRLIAEAHEKGHLIQGDQQFSLTVGNIKLTVKEPQKAQSSVIVPTILDDVQDFNAEGIHHLDENDIDIDDDDDDVVVEELELDMDKMTLHNLTRPLQAQLNAELNRYNSQDALSVIATGTTKMSPSTDSQIKDRQQADKDAGKQVQDDDEEEEEEEEDYSSFDEEDFEEADFEFPTRETMLKMMKDLGFQHLPGPSFTFDVDKNVFVNEQDGTQIPLSAPDISQAASGGGGGGSKKSGVNSKSSTAKSKDSALLPDFILNDKIQEMFSQSMEQFKDDMQRQIGISSLSSTKGTMKAQSPYQFKVTQVKPQSRHNKHGSLTELDKKFGMVFGGFNINGDHVPRSRNHNNTNQLSAKQQQQQYKQQLSQLDKTMVKKNNQLLDEDYQIVYEENLKLKKLTEAAKQSISDQIEQQAQAQRDFKSLTQQSHGGVQNIINDNPLIKKKHEPTGLFLFGSEADKNPLLNGSYATFKNNRACPVPPAELLNHIRNSVEARQRLQQQLQSGVGGQGSGSFVGPSSSSSAGGGARSSQARHSSNSNSNMNGGNVQIKSGSFEDNLKGIFKKQQQQKQQIGVKQGSSKPTPSSSTAAGRSSRDAGCVF
ncbi:hypothetical protein MIR68_002127 [Amoeboaphelidium protococcarum]|nr:hypothetical protein MIR68_002127 [Amoeboaphelidium protococcarum]